VKKNLFQPILFNRNNSTNDQTFADLVLFNYSFSRTEMKKILIIVPRFVPFTNQASYVFPLGLAYISASLKQAGEPVDILNLNYYDSLQTDLLKEQLAMEKYSYILTGGLSHHYKIIKELILDLRKISPSSQIITGGGIITSSPQLMFDFLAPDYIVIGEGEVTIIELINCLNQNKPLADITGIGYKDETGSLIITPPRKAIKNIDEIPFPDLDGFEIKKFLKIQKPNDNLFTYIADNPRIMPIIASRGCPYNCTFCFHPIGRKYRSRSIDNFMEETEYLIKRYGVNNLAIMDELLSADRKRLFELCERLIELPEKINWMCQLRVDSIDLEMLLKMKEAGCYLISYGFESASDKVLSSMGKKINSRQIRHAMELTRKAGINIQANFIFGDPAETTETSTETLNFWKEHQDYHLTLGYIRPYPGSVLWKNIIKENKPDNNEKLLLIDSCVDNPPNISRMNEKEWFSLQKEVQRAIISNDHFGKIINSESQSEKIYTITVQCPHCHQETTYKNFQQRIKGIFKLACRKCNQAMNISPMIFEHIRKDYPRNLKVYKTIISGNVPVTVTPCMNEAEFAAMNEISLKGCNIVNFMDIDPNKSSHYAGKKVYPRTRENLASLAENHYFLIPLTRYADRIFNNLLSFGIAKDRICRLDTIVVGKYEN
jgi:anaerobic magnesium-protoporphyrin IX monomethyl ester cyclase